MHCSATKPELSSALDAEEVRRWHTLPKSKKGRGWSDIGYHYFIKTDGTIEEGRPLRRSGAHVKGYNRKSIGICYAGGLDADGNPKDTRTQAQKTAAKIILKKLIALKDHPEIEISPVVQVVGHRDLSPDRNGDGKITKDEWLKDCPCYDAKKEHFDLNK